MIYIRVMAARKTCPPSSSPERRASGLPPPVGRGCRAATTVMSDVVAVEQSFLSSLASKGLFLLFLLLYVAALLFRLQQMY